MTLAGILYTLTVCTNEKKQYEKAKLLLNSGAS